MLLRNSVFTHREFLDHSGLSIVNAATNSDNIPSAIISAELLRNISVSFARFSYRAIVVRVSSRFSPIGSVGLVRTKVRPNGLTLWYANPPCRL